MHLGFYGNDSFLPSFWCSVDSCLSGSIKFPIKVHSAPIKLSYFSQKLKSYFAQSVYAYCVNIDSEQTFEMS